MNKLFTFDDVLIKPRFSTIASRRDVDLTYSIGNSSFALPVISANMDTITGADMARVMAKAGGVACLHRFASTEENVKMFHGTVVKGIKPMVSVGLGKPELERAEALVNAGAEVVVIDVAHGAQMGVVEQVRDIKTLLGGKVQIVVGNVATAECIRAVNYHLGFAAAVDYFKVGIGPGSACTTRTQTGVGIPQLSAIIDCVSTGCHIIADGGMKKPGDVAKALGAGAKMVMLGGMLSGTEETPGEVHTSEDGKKFKKYRGSASKESYEAQGKIGTHRTAEGESFLVPFKGSVWDVLLDIEGGVRSAMTYVDARTLQEFKENCEFVHITPTTVGENGAHGKK
jgi:IMP dehydrogenase